MQAVKGWFRYFCPTCRIERDGLLYGDMWSWSCPRCGVGGKTERVCGAEFTVGTSSVAATIVDIDHERRSVTIK